MTNEEAGEWMEVCWNGGVSSDDDEAAPPSAPRGPSMSRKGDRSDKKPHTREMILWFLKDRKFAVDEAVSKLAKAIKWRQDFHVSELSEESVKGLYQTGKAYVHHSFDINGRPVLVVVAAKHFPSRQDPLENEKLCAFLVEKALRKLPMGTDNILGIFDLRGFGVENGDLQFLKFLVRFCDVETMRKEYFTEETVPHDFRR